MVSALALLYSSIWSNAFGSVPARKISVIVFFV